MKIVLLLGLLTFTRITQATIIQFIYIEASEGNSSGGHVALQLDDTVYHYQYENALIRLFKQKAADFRVNYQLRQNRTLHIADIEASETSFTRINNYVKLRYFEQTQQLSRLQTANQDHFLLQALLHQKSAQQTDLPTSAQLPQLRGAGLFYNTDNVSTKTSTGSCNTALASTHVMQQLRRQLANTYGKNFLVEKIRAVRSSLRQISPATASAQYRYSEHYSDLLNALLALQTLHTSRALTAHSCFHIPSSARHLTSADLHRIQHYQQQLLHAAHSLVTSNRPDWGYALFITLARLITTEHSLQNHQWTFLDDTDAQANTIPLQQLAFYSDFLHKQRQDDLQYLLEGLAHWSTTDDEYENYYTHLEIAANRYQQWLNSDKTGSIRLDSEHTLPEKPIPLQPFLITDLSTQQLTTALQQQAHHTEQLLKQYETDNSYHLISKNCVTALFELINASVSGQAQALLGGTINPSTHFIPFQAFNAVQQTYRVVKTRTLLAYRQQKLAKLYDAELAGWVYARESNIFSSSLYRHNPDDAWFVFFTDDVPWFRPVFGAVNIAAATSQSVLGLVRLPFDNGKNLKIGVRGLLASLPELAFFNIRKGSYPYAIEPE